jgi:hypothetical protein
MLRTVHSGPFLFCIHVDYLARSTLRKFWKIQDIPEYEPTFNDYIGKVYFTFIKFDSQNSQKTISLHIRSHRLSEELQTDLYHEYKLISEARQQAHADAIPSKRWAGRVCSRLMLRVSHHQHDLMHLDEEPTDIIQGKKEWSFAPEMRCR